MLRKKLLYFLPFLAPMILRSKMLNEQWARKSDNRKQNENSWAVDTPYIGEKKKEHNSHTEENIAVDEQPVEACVVVAYEVSLADRSEAPERILERHVHEQEAGDRCLRLAVASLRVQSAVGAEERAQVVLPRNTVDGKQTIKGIRILEENKHVKALTLARRAH